MPEQSKAGLDISNKNAICVIDPISTLNQSATCFEILSTMVKSYIQQYANNMTETWAEKNPLQIAAINFSKMCPFTAKWNPFLSCTYDNFPKSILLLTAHCLHLPLYKNRLGSIVTFKILHNWLLAGPWNVRPAYKFSLAQCYNENMPLLCHKAISVPAGFLY